MDAFTGKVSAAESLLLHASLRPFQHCSSYSSSSSSMNRWWRREHEEGHKHERGSLSSRDGQSIWPAQVVLARDWPLTHQGTQQQHTDSDERMSSASPVAHAMFLGSSDEPEDHSPGSVGPGAPQSFLSPKALPEGTQLHSTWTAGPHITGYLGCPPAAGPMVVRPERCLSQWRCAGSINCHLLGGFVHQRM